MTEITHDAIPSYRFNYLPKRYNQNLSRPTKLMEMIKVMKKLISIQ